MKLIELAEEIGLRPQWAAATDGGEYHSACPACGGNDRFIVQPHKKMKHCNGFFWCRQCNISGDAIQFGREFLGLTFHAAAERVHANIPENSRLLRGILPTNLRSNKPFTPATLKAPSQLWLSKAFTVVEDAHHQLLQQQSILQHLEKRGLPIAAVKQYKLGWIKQDTWDDGGNWGVEKDKVWLPKGIVIPTQQKDMIVRIKIRRDDYTENDKLPKYAAVSGSMNGLNLIGNPKNAVMIIVESELDAYALHHMLHDFIVIVAVGSNTKNPDNVTDSIAKQKKCLLACHDNDEEGLKLLYKWQKLYPHTKAYPTPQAKDIGDAIKGGFDVKKWLLKAIPTLGIK